MPFQENINEPPTDIVLQMQSQNIPTEEIIRKLQEQGYPYELISDALNQAETKKGIDTHPEMQPSVLNENNMQPTDAPAPTPTQRIQTTQPPQNQASLIPTFTPFSNPQYEQSSRNNIEQIEEIAEAIIDEKWQRAFEDIGNLAIWKEKVHTDVSSIKQEMLRLESRFENLQKSVIGKIQDYDKNISDVGTEIKALEKLLQNILKPLTQNVRELTKITEKLKK